MNMDYSNVLYGVLGYLGKAAIVFGAFYFGRSMGTELKPKWVNYFAILGMIAFFSLMYGSSYGTHIENADPLKGGGETVVDFETTDKERNEHGLIMFFSLSIPALYGIYKKQQVEPLPKKHTKARAVMEREAGTEKKGRNQTNYFQRSLRGSTQKTDGP